MFKRHNDNGDLPEIDSDNAPAPSVHGHSGENLDDSVVAEENAADAVKKLREKLKKSEAERMEYLTGWQRAKADLINARKRDEADRVEFMKFANERLDRRLSFRYWTASNWPWPIRRHGRKPTKIGAPGLNTYILN
jgi:molecular chaperone GrpE (heat shock protein)